MSQHFGGPWTELKLDVLKRYLESYVKALKNTPFHKVYIDSFAGAGTVETKTGRVLAGSARIALDTEGFDEYVFIEREEDYLNALQELCKRYPGKNVTLLSGDANRQVKKWINEVAQTQWMRGVAFFDPFGMELEWDTLQAVAQTRVLDVWYWFSLSGLYRQTPRSLRKISDDKIASVTKVFGTDQWLTDFYSEDPQLSWFEETAEYVRADVQYLEDWARRRLETIFPAVAKPLRLPLTGPPRYSFFFAVSNPDPKAQGLAMRIATHILGTKDASWRGR
ncbi:MAG: three-Cys-motif partner protein TcmP [Firmicutes bacterium]|nr:three-Cys-motif partner protein TcmP [Bacillota bacterium]